MEAETRARLRRVAVKAGKIGKIAAITLGAIVALVGVALAVLGTSFGGERVRRFVLPQVNRGIAGHLEIGRLETHLTGIELWDVTLTDPEGQVVAHVDRIELGAQLRRLLARQVEVSRIVIERPDLRLVQSARGLNLSRAIAAREPAAPPPPPAPPGPPPQLDLALRQLTIVGGRFDFRDSQPQGAAPIKIDKLEVTGSAQVALATNAFTAKLALDAESQLPLRAPLVLRLEGAGRGADGKAELRITWGDAVIDLGLVSRDERTQTATIAQITVPPGPVQAFAPGLPLRATLGTKGTIDRRGDRIDVVLALRAADLHGDLRAGVDLGRPAVDRLHLSLKDIDLGQLVRGGPPSRFDLNVEGQGAGRDLEQATGRLRVQIPPGSLDGRAFGPVRIEAQAANAEVVLQALEIALPGLTVSGQGRGGAKQLQAEAKLDARDLGLLARSLRLPASLGLAGRGRLALAASGRPAAAKLVVTGGFPALRVAGTELTGLTLSANTSDLGRAPAGTNLQVKLARARVGTQTVRDLDLGLSSVGADGLRAALTLAGPLPLSLTAAGRTSANRTVFDLDSLTLAYPEASWRLSQPVRLRVNGDDLALGKVDLQAAPDQRLVIDLSRRGNRIDAHLTLAHVDLGRLPVLAQPPGNRLGGIVDATAEVSGRLPRPDAKVDVKLQRASVGTQLTELGVGLKAQHHGGRVQGQLAASLLGAQHDVDFDLPVAWPPPPAARLHLRVAIGQTDLARLAKLGRDSEGKKAGAPGGPLPLQGQLAAILELDGPAADPALSLTASAQQLRWAGDPLDDVHLDVQDPIGKPLRVNARTSILGRKSGVQIDSPVVLASWLRRPPDEAVLLALPFTVRADVDRLPLAAVSPRTRGKPDVTGTVSVHAALTGPASRLHGTLTLDADQVAGMGIPPTNAQLITRLGEGRQGLDAKLTVSQQHKGLTQPIAQLTAALGLGLDDLLGQKPGQPSLAKLGNAKVEIKGHLGPLAMQRMVAGDDGGPKGRRPFRADVEANLNASGTLADPRLELRAAVQGAQLGGRSLGGGRVQVIYRDAQPVVNLQLNSAGGGQLTLGAKAKVDLSLPAVMKGIKAEEVPLDAKLAARGFDLAFLSGIADDVRTVEGRLEAEAQVTGKAGAPQMVGKLAWKSGRLVLAGLGEMRDIELAAHGDPRQMVLDRLFARSGAGSATVTAQAVRQADGRTLDLDAKMDVSRFRVLTDGQPLGALTLAAKAEGTIAPDRIAIATTINEARMDLAEGDRRDLQSLKRPDDVVLMANGEPLDKAQARRYEALVNRAPVPAPGAASAKAPAGAGPSRDSAEKAATTRITVEAPRNLWVRGADANLEAGLDPGFMVLQTDQMRIFGTVKVKRGFVEVMGRRFDVGAGSSVQFVGPAARPVLTIDATYKLEQSKPETKVVVHVEGPADKLSITMSSPGHPEYGDSDILTMILTGRAPDANDKSTSGFQAGKQGRSLVGGLLASRVQKALTAHLPIDVLNIDLGDGESARRLEAGTYLSDDVYVAYVGRMGGDPTVTRENRNELHLEYQLTPRWSFEATYGDARRGSVDLLWTRNY